MRQVVHTTQRMYAWHGHYEVTRTDRWRRWPKASLRGSPRRAFVSAMMSVGLSLAGDERLIPYLDE